MNVSVGAGIKNKFTIVVEDIETKEKREYTAHNIVLNSMWSRLVNFQPFFVNIHFGTGSGTFDDPTRTSLYTHLGTKAATTEFQTRALPTSQWRRKIVLNPEEYVGATITEIGVAYGSTASNLVTHAAPKDSEGNPIAIGPKKDTEIVTIYADMYFVLQENMYGGKIKWVTPLANNELLSYLMGGSYPTQQFRVGKNKRDGNGVVSSFLGQSSNILPANWIKDITNKKVTTPVMRLGATIGNGDIWEIGLGISYGTFRAVLPIDGVHKNYPIMNSAIGTGDGDKVNFDISHKPIVVSSETIYVNGVPQTRDVDYHIYHTAPKGENVLPNCIIASNSDGTRDIFPTFDGSTSGEYYIYGLPEWFVYKFDNPQKVDGVSFFQGSEYNVKVKGFQIEALILSEWQTIFDGIVSSTTGWATFDFGQIYESTEFKITIKSAWGGIQAKVFEISLLSAESHEAPIVFLTPPPAGAVITADYTVDYIPKDEFHVLDLQAAIQYGEVI